MRAAEISKKSNHSGNARMAPFTIKELRRNYPTDESRLKFILLSRNEGLDECINPKCGGSITQNYRHLVKHARSSNKKPTKGLYCSECMVQVYPFANTVFDKCKYSSEEILEIVYDLITTKSGVSANNYCRRYGKSYHSMLHFHDRVTFQMKIPLQALDFGAAIEIDETQIPTGNKGLNRTFERKRGKGTENHSYVFGVTSRYGRATRLFHIEDTQWTTINRVLKSVLHPHQHSLPPEKITVYTDEASIYNKLSSIGYKHKRIHHGSLDYSIKYVNGDISTNNIENRFSQLKRKILGTYINISSRKAQQYLDLESYKMSFSDTYDNGFHRFFESLGPVEYKISKLRRI